MSCLRSWCIVAAACLAIFRLFGDPALTPWTPIFKGIDYTIGTNSTRSGDFINLSVGRVFRVDLKDPDVRLFVTPRIENFNPGVRETAGMTVSRFLQINQLQVAVNGGFFDPTGYYLPENTPMVISGLAVSGGEIVSPQNTRSYAAAVLFDANKVGRIVHTNWPAVSIDGVEHAISGNYPLLYRGKNLGRQSGDGNVNPRTALGLSEDGRYLFLICIDGRQPGYSSGAYDFETAAWLLLLGAFDAVNLDGGGSTTMVMADSTGKPKRLNRSSAVADSGRERTVGSHFGVFANPLPGFINQVQVATESESATISWTTVAPATSQVRYGTEAILGSESAQSSQQTTNHSISIAALKPGGTYYYRVISTTSEASYESPVFQFTTTNPVTTNVVVQLTSPWRYTTENQDGKNWSALDFPEDSWSGPGDGLLWVNIRNNNPGVGPLGTQMPTDSATGFPYSTYYARTHFELASRPTGATMTFFGYIDDGAVVYLNGKEVQRIRMEPPPSPIENITLALTPPCDGDATCADEFILEENDAELLREGDNVLAVEVHNYNARSGDITMGFEVAIHERIVSRPMLLISTATGQTTLRWNHSGFVLEQAESPNGPWSQSPGPVTSSPFVVPEGTTSRYYRLRK